MDARESARCRPPPAGWWPGGGWSGVFARVRLLPSRRPSIALAGQYLPDLDCGPDRAKCHVKRNCHTFTSILLGLAEAGLTLFGDKVLDLLLLRQACYPVNEFLDTGVASGLHCLLVFPSGH